MGRKARKSGSGAGTLVVAIVMAIIFAPKSGWTVFLVLTFIATWQGDYLNDALVLLLRANKLDAFNNGAVIGVSNGSAERVTEALHQIGQLDQATAIKTVAEIENLDRDKWDWALPMSVKRAAFASTHLDIDGALAFARSTARSATDEPTTK